MFYWLKMASRTSHQQLHTYLGCNSGEDNPVLSDALLCSVVEHVGLSGSREAQQPQDTVGHGLEDVDPAVHGGWVHLVELVEVAVDDGILGQSILLPR